MSNPIDIQAIRGQIAKALAGDGTWSNALACTTDAIALCNALEAANARIAEMKAEHEPMPSVRLTLHPAVLEVLRKVWMGAERYDVNVAYISLPTEIKKLVEGE